MRFIEALFAFGLGFGLLGFGLGLYTIDIMNNIVTGNVTIQNGTVVPLASGDFWVAENAILHLGTIVGGIVIVFAGMYIAIKRPPEDGEYGD